MARRTIDASVKTAVLEALATGAKPKDLAVQYQLSLPTIYNWKKAAAVTPAVETPVEG